MITIRNDTSGISRIIEYAIIFGIMLLIFGVISFVVEESVNENTEQVFVRNLRNIADRVADAVDEAVRFSIHYPNATFIRTLTLPSALRSAHLGSRAQSYYITLTNDIILVASSDESIVIKTTKTIPPDIIVSGSVSPIDKLIIKYSNDDGIRHLRLALGDEIE